MFVPPSACSEEFRQNLELQKRLEVQKLEESDRRRRNFALFALLAPLSVFLLLFSLPSARIVVRFFLSIYFYESLFLFACSVAKSFDLIQSSEEPPTDYALNNRNEKFVKQKMLIWLCVYALGCSYLFYLILA